MSYKQSLDQRIEDLKKEIVSAYETHRALNEALVNSKKKLGRLFKDLEEASSYK